MWRCRVAISYSGTIVKAFQEGRDAVQDNLRTGRPHLKNNTVQLLASLLDDDRRRIARELVCHKTVLLILQDILGYRKLQRVGYTMKFPRCKNNMTMQSHRTFWTGTKGKVTSFLDESSLWMKPGLGFTDQIWNANQMNGSFSVVLVQRMCTLHNVLWKRCSL